MRIGLQVGFGNLLGAELLQKLREQGFQLIRIDCQQNRDPALAQEVLDAGLQPLVIIRSAEQIKDLPAGVDIEVGNEPDIGKFGWTESTYRVEVLRAVPAAENRNPIWVGVVSNLNSRGFRFLETLPWRELPNWVGCSVHRYPDNAGPQRSHLKNLIGGRLTRDDEIKKLKKLVGSRPLGLSEIGYHTAYSVWTDTDVAKHMAWERQFFEQHGFDFAIAYQLRDGAADDPHHDAHYGFMRDDGSWKPVAEAWTATAESQHS